MRKYPFVINENNLKTALEQAQNEAKTAGDLQTRIKEKKTMGLEIVASLYRTISITSYALEADKATVKQAFGQYAAWMTTHVIYGGFITPKIYVDILGAAILAADAALIKTLTNYDKDRYTSPREKPSETELMVTEFTRLLLAGQTSQVQPQAPKLLKQFTRETPLFKSKYDKIPEIISAIANANQVELDAAATARALTQEITFQKAPKEPKFDPLEYFLDFPAIILLSEAKKRGMQIKPEKAWVAKEYLF